MTSTEAVGEPTIRFFTPSQFAALHKLSEVLMPPMRGMPGALECGAPEFLDFLIGASPADRQDALSQRPGYVERAAPRSSSANRLPSWTPTQADAVIRPLLAPVPWAYDLPKDPAMHFIAEAHRDIRTATQNSREWASAGAASGRRSGFGGGGSYMNPDRSRYAQRLEPMPAKEYDVLIVGSGHSGGMAANILTKQGINCLMLNAGPESDFEHNRVNKAVHDLPYRGFGKPGRLPHVYQANEFNANQWVDETENPYTHDPANLYNWVRVRLVGGRSLFWARQSFRLSDFEFKAGDLEGTGAELADQPGRSAPLLLAGGRDLPGAAGARKAGREFPDGNFVGAQLRPGQRDASRSLSALGKAARHEVLQDALFGRTERACQFGQPAAAGRDGDREAGDGVQRHRARNHHGQEDGPRERGAFRGPAFAARDAT